jgi:uncharacterized membrane protein
VRFETSVDIEAPQHRVWEVLTDLEAWPRRIETVDVVEQLTAAPLTVGSRVRLKQPKLPEGVWDVTAWDAPAWFEWRQRSSGVTSVAGHRVRALSRDRSRLSLSLEMRGLIVPLVGRLSKGMIDRYMTLEADGIRRAAEDPAQDAPTTG